jgi:uncharacterized membrane protein
MSLSMIILLISDIVGIGILIFSTLYIIKSGRSPIPGDTVPDKMEMRKYRAFGIFYCNPDDPRGLVPKSVGYGWTINLRHKEWAASYVAALVVAILIISIGPLVPIWLGVYK